MLTFLQLNRPIDLAFLWTGGSGRPRGPRGYTIRLGIKFSGTRRTGNRPTRFPKEQVGRLEIISTVAALHHVGVIPFVPSSPFPAEPTHSHWGLNRFPLSDALNHQVVHSGVTIMRVFMVMVQYAMYREGTIASVTGFNACALWTNFWGA